MFCRTAIVPGIHLGRRDGFFQVEEFAVRPAGFAQTLRFRATWNGNGIPDALRDFLREFLSQATLLP
jgi:hypothetical protein